MGKTQEDGKILTLEAIDLGDLTQIKRDTDEEDEKEDRGFFGLNRDVIRQIERKNWAFVAILIVAGIVGATLAFTLTYRDETNQIEAEFKNLQEVWGNELLESFSRHSQSSGSNFEVNWKLNQPVAAQKCNISYHEAIYGEGWCEYFNQGMQHAQFETMAKEIISLKAGVQALEWVPRVPKAVRPLFEEMAPNLDGRDDVAITWFQDGEFVRSTEDKDFYYPVYFTEPLVDNIDAYLFDLHSLPVQRAAIENAMAHPNQPAASGPVVLARNLGPAGIDSLAFFTIGQVVVDGDLKGFSVAAFLYSFLISSAITTSQKENIYIHVFDQFNDESLINPQRGNLFCREDYGSWVHTEVSSDSSWVTIARTDEYEETLSDLMKRGQTAGNGDSFYQTELVIYDRKLVAVIHTTEEFWDTARTTEPAVLCSVIVVVTTMLIVLVVISGISKVREKIRARDEQSMRTLKTQRQFEMVVDRLRSTEKNLRESQAHLSNLKLRDYAISGIADPIVEEDDKKSKDPTVIIDEDEEPSIVDLAEHLDFDALTHAEKKGVLSQQKNFLEDVKEINWKTWLFLASLFVVGCIVGSVTFYTMTESEKKFFIEDFDVFYNEIAESIKDSFVENYEHVDLISISMRDLKDYKSQETPCNETVHGAKSCRPFNYGLQRDIFREEAQRMLDIGYATDGIFWIPVVTHDERPLYEEMASDWLGEDIQFGSLNNDDGTIQTREEASVYYPLYYIAPENDYQTSAFLFDMGSNLEAWPELEEALDSQKMRLTRGIPSGVFHQARNVNIGEVGHIERSEGYNQDVIIFRPVAVDGEIIGVVGMEVNIFDDLKQSLGQHDSRFMEAHVFDTETVDNGLYQETGYGHWLATLVDDQDGGWQKQDPSVDIAAEITEVSDHDLYLDYLTFEVLSRTWVLVLETEPGFWKLNLTELPAAVCASVIILTALMVVILLFLFISLIRRHHVTEMSMASVKGQKQFKRVLESLAETAHELKNARSRLYEIRTFRPTVRSYAVPDSEAPNEDVPLRLKDVLKHVTAAELFKDFVHKYGSPELITFWLDVTEYEMHLRKRDIKERFELMLKYYIVDDAPYEINFSKALKQELMKSKPDREAFSVARDQAFQMLEENFWTNFKETFEYKICQRLSISKGNIE